MLATSPAGRILSCQSITPLYWYMAASGTDIRVALATTPASNEVFWQEKFDGTVRRDVRVAPGCEIRMEGRYYTGVLP